MSKRRTQAEIQRAAFLMGLSYSQLQSALARYRAAGDAPSEIAAEMEKLRRIRKGIRG